MFSIDVIHLGLDSNYPQVIYGLVMIGLVLGLNSLAIIWTYFFVKSVINKNKHKPASKPRATLFFITCAQFLALTQLISICIWALSLMAMGFFSSWDHAIQFSASSYTTMGTFTKVFPQGWHLVPTFIAFSGLFTFAWVATSTISILTALINSIEAEKKREASNSSSLNKQ
jgi:hypothetical protein